MFLVVPLIIALLALTPLEIVAQAPKIKLPVEVNPSGYGGDHGLSFKNVTLYLNTTDKNYHIKCLIQNRLPETRTGPLDIGFRFIDQATDTDVKEVFNPASEVTMNPGATIPLDISTGYAADQGNQFHFMKLIIVTP